MPYPFVLNVPMEPSLELMAPTSSYGMDSKREFFNNIIDEINRTGLIMPLVYSQGSDTCGCNYVN